MHFLLIGLTCRMTVMAFNTSLNEHAIYNSYMVYSRLADVELIKTAAISMTVQNLINMIDPKIWKKIRNKQIKRSTLISC